MTNGIYKTIRNCASYVKDSFINDMKECWEIFQENKHIFNPVKYPIAFKGAGIFGMYLGTVEQIPHLTQFGIGLFAAGEIGDQVNHARLEKRVSELEPKKGTIPVYDRHTRINEV